MLSEKVAIGLANGLVGISEMEQARKGAIDPYEFALYVLEVNAVGRILKQSGKEIAVVCELRVCRTRTNGPFEILLRESHKFPIAAARNSPKSTGVTADARWPTIGIDNVYSNPETQLAN